MEQQIGSKLGKEYIKAVYCHPAYLTYMQSTCSSWAELNWVAAQQCECTRWLYCTLSVQFSRSVESNSLWPHGLHHTRLPCQSPTPRVYSNSCPLSQWCHPSISSSVVPFSSCLQSFPASGSVLHIRWPKYWSFSVSISPSNEYSGLISFRIDWLDLLAVQGTLKSLLQHHNSKASILWCSTFFIVQLTCIHDYWKNRSFD